MDVRIQFDAEGWLACLVLVVVSDVLFFGTLGRRIYPATLEIDWRYAPPAYAIIALVLSSVRVTSGRPVLCGALIGFAIYGVFNSTELAIRSDWRDGVAPYVDLAYGTTLCAAVVGANHRLH